MLCCKEKMWEENKNDPVGLVSRVWSGFCAFWLYLEFLWGGGWERSPHTSQWHWSCLLQSHRVTQGLHPEFGLKVGPDDPVAHFQPSWFSGSLCTLPASSTAARNWCITKDFTPVLPKSEQHLCSGSVLCGWTPQKAPQKLLDGNACDDSDGNVTLQLQSGWTVFFLFSFFSLIAPGYINCVFTAGK